MMFGKNAGVVKQMIDELGASCYGAEGGISTY